MTNNRDDQRPAPSMDAGLQAHIGRQLRQLYDQLISEPVPDRFRELLDRLENHETPADAASASSPVLQPDGAVAEPEDDDGRPSETHR